MTEKPSKTPLFIRCMLFLFSILLVSYPARNLDVWLHLTNGRDVYRTLTLSQYWLYDTIVFTVYSVLNGPGLAAVKSLFFAVLTLFMLRYSTTTSWLIALTAICLAILAMSNRFLLQPQSVSVFGLFLTYWHLQNKTTLKNKEYLPSLTFILLFILWANIDYWFVLGLVVSFLFLAGKAIDLRNQRAIIKSLLSSFSIILLLIVSSCVSVLNWKGLNIPEELRFTSNNLVVQKPFSKAYIELFHDNSCALAYFPLLLLSLISFLINYKSWKWSWFLPWLLLAFLTIIEARAIPFFAVLAGPMMALNFQQFFAGRTFFHSTIKWIKFLAILLAAILTIAFFLSAWTGYIQGPPYEPRKWAVEMPPSFIKSSDFYRKTVQANLWPKDTKTLHASKDTNISFSWLIPEDLKIQNDTVVYQLISAADEESNRKILLENRINRVVFWINDQNPNSQILLNKLLLQNDQWELLSLAGGVFIFGFKDKLDINAEPINFNGWKFDSDRIAFNPEATDRVPNFIPANRPWWSVLTKPAFPTRPAGRDEATAILRCTDAKLQMLPYRNLQEWESSQAVGLISSAFSWVNPIHVTNASIRLTLFRPSLPADNSMRLSPSTEWVLRCQQIFANDKGSVSVSDLYSAVRSTRRAILENPNDPNSHLLIAKIYSILISQSLEARWSDREGIPQLRRIRQVQMSAALNRAISINPRLAVAHFELANLYRTIGCIDLALEHLKSYKNLVVNDLNNPLSNTSVDLLNAELKQLEKQVEERKATYEKESATYSVYDRAILAVQMELGGLGRSILLKSDVSAFGAQGVELELDLLLRTGRPLEVLEMTTPEVGGSLGPQKYHWTLAQAFFAIGQYESADQELFEMIKSGGIIPPKELGYQMSLVVSKSTLDSQPILIGWYDMTLQVLSRLDLQSQIEDTSRKLAQRVNMMTLRGVTLIEAGFIPNAVEEFNNALMYSPNRFGSGQLDFTGRRIAWDCLNLINDVNQLRK